MAGSADILKAWPPGIHTSTFQGNPFASAMASATIDVIRDQDLLTHVREVVEPLLLDRLGNLATSDTIRAVRCVGAQAAIEFVDLDGKPDADIVLEIQRSCLREKILVYGGGRWSNVLMLLPPILIDEETLSRSLETIHSIIAGKGRA